MTTDTLSLIPQPRSLTLGEFAFSLNADTVIVLPASTNVAGSDQDFFAAQLLQGEIAAATGLRLAIERRTTPRRQGNVICLLRMGRDAWAFAPEIAYDEPLAEQGYLLEIDEDRVVVGSDDGAGLYYGVATLRQIARTRGSRWPVLSIQDAPVLPNRGVMLDVSRAKVPTLESLLSLAETMAGYKLNVLQLYTEHTFRFASHPDIGADCGSLSNEDILALDAHCRRHHVRLIPNLQSFGHMAHILHLPAYRHLAETRVGWSVSPAVEGTYELLGDMFADMLPAFTESEVNIGCDETYDLGMGRSKAMADEQGLGRVYLGHIMRLREIAARLGKRIQVWGDIIQHHPELIPEVPEDVLWMDWGYEARDEYASVRSFADVGRPFWICPGTSAWNSLFPRIDNSNANIRVFVRDGVAAGAEGMLNTDWGDGGHYHPLGQSYYGYIYGAEQSWTGATTDDATFDAALGPLQYGDRTGQVVAAIRRLGSATTLPGVYRGNGSNLTLALFDDPLVGKTVVGMTDAHVGRPAEVLPDEALAEIVAAGEHAAAIFEASRAASPDAAGLREMAFSARLMVYAAEKTRVGQWIRMRWPFLPNPEGGDAYPEALNEIDVLVDRLRVLRQEMQTYRAEFQQVWMLRSRRSEIQLSLRHFDRALERFDAAMAWMEAQRVQLAATGTLDVEMSTYDGWTYCALWDAGRLHQEIDELDEEE